MIRLLLLALSFAALAPTSFTASAQGWDPRTEEANKIKLVARSAEAIELFLESDPTLQIFFEEAYGYVVFPRVTKGAFGVGGARGRGVLYKQGLPTKKAYLNQLTIGVQLGGKTYAEIIFFRDEASYNTFENGDFAFSAQASAVIATDGAGATADYQDDVAVFTRERAGALFEASIGGQNFSVRELK